MYHVPCAFQFICGCSDEGGEDGDTKEESKIPGGGERLEIASCTHMTWFCVVGRVGGGLEGDGRTVC